MLALMARVPEVEIARLKAELSLARLVDGCAVVLDRQGGDLLGRCHFHHDKTPSLLVSPSKNVWHCLDASQAGGSVIDWVSCAAVGMSMSPGHWSSPSPTTHGRGPAPDKTPVVLARGNGTQRRRSGFGSTPTPRLAGPNGSRSLGVRR